MRSYPDLSQYVQLAIDLDVLRLVLIDRLFNSIHLVLMPLKFIRFNVNDLSIVKISY